MRVAILHFHLRRGGVGSVMLRQALSLAETTNPPEVVFLVGAAPDPAPVPVFVIPELDYDSFSSRDSSSVPPQASDGVSFLAAAILRTLKQAFPTGCDVLHVHNPLLCKNTRLLGALRLVQDQGQALLIHIHDLAEDFRPRVYEKVWPYPANCDYAVINSRDRAHLIAAGLEPSHVHLLPNPLARTEPETGLTQDSQKRRNLALYPVRAIRRKNIGEAVLLSRFLPEGTTLALTLPPTSRGDLTLYQSWVDWTAQEASRVRFNVGLEAHLSQLYKQAFCVVTTSVKEGFGYSYLDPLVLGIPVTGRAIPHIIQDFAEQGVHFPHFYSQIRIPGESLPSAILASALQESLTTVRQAFSSAFEPDKREILETLLEALTRRFQEKSLDFGALNEGLQRFVLKKMREDSTYEQEIVQNNPFLVDFFRQLPSKEQQEEARRAALAHYSSKSYAEHLLKIYAVTAQRSARGKIDKGLLLAQYLQPDSFFLVAL
jgi:glycosyltransferase involved in cell wall biosynthesis